MNRHILRKSTFREIKKSLGRYLAIVAIVALGVGFFAGLKVTKEVMLKTANKYLNEQKFYDYQAISTIGYDDDSVKIFQESDDVTCAEGSISHDAFLRDKSGTDRILTVKSMTEEINVPQVVEGRLPERDDECVVDQFFINDAAIGDVLELSDENSKENLDYFKHKEYTIVGMANSPLYLSLERGTTKLGNGTVAGFAYINKDGFDSDIYTEVYLNIDSGEDRFSEEGTDLVKEKESTIEDLADEARIERYDSIMQEFKDELSEQAEERGATLDQLLTMQDTTVKELADEEGIKEGKKYIVSRSSNVGYATFDENSNIVASISRIFPAFFFLVAALVCMTTMTRMIDDQRTQIGVLKALGYRNSAILAKYLTYSGSAATIGAIGGYLLGIRIFPNVIWKAYSMMYQFADSPEYVVDVPLEIFSLVVALICSMGVTWIACVNDFRIAPAQLIRPKSPKSGKRIFLERITPIWKRISFLYKVSIRNIFRYRGRLVMMVLGISGCTALLIAGFGIDTTIGGIADYQFGEIMKYDYAVQFDRNMDSDKQQEFLEYAKGRYDKIEFVDLSTLDLVLPDENIGVNMIADDGTNLQGFIDLHDDDHKVDYPKTGEAVIGWGLYWKYDIDIGDEITLRSDGDEFKVKVSGICDNYIYDYVFINEETYADGFDKAYESRTALVLDSEDATADKIHEDAAFCTNYEYATATTANVDMLERVRDMMKSLDAVVFAVIISAALLAFIVLFNLTNINIMERVREIATIKVLGFTSYETSQYVFRENIFLTAFGALLGIPLGRLLLRYVINEIKMNMILFVPHLDTMDYVYSVALTFAFAFFVNIVMRWRLAGISMTESLKSIE